MKLKIIALVAASTALATADPGRSSANYSLAHEATIGAYGTRSTSANYTLDDAGDSAAAVATSTNYTHRDGFAGQLIDPAALLITGAGSVLEGSTRDLDVDLIYDDDTTEPDVPAVWSVDSGPLASVGASGLVTPQIVYLNTAAWVRADYLGLSDTHRIVVNNWIKDNYGTYADDGIGDFWQVSYFGIDSPDGGPNVDPDGDGQSNLLEYLAGYIPNDTSSFLATSLLSEDTIELSKVIPNRTYTLSRSTDLSIWTPTGATLAPTSELTDQAITDPAPPAGVRTFYKIDIEE